jgi:transcriptional regulator with XRE-family HTH domain
LLKSQPKTQAALQRLGAAVRRERQRRKISQEDFAELAGVHRNYVGRVERAEINLSFDTLHGIAGACGLSLGELCTRARV